MERDKMSSNDIAFICSYLEQVAKLVEAIAKDPADAARIIREAKPE